MTSAGYSTEETSIRQKKLKMSGQGRGYRGHHYLLSLCSQVPCYLRERKVDRMTVLLVFHKKKEEEVRRKNTNSSRIAQQRKVEKIEYIFVDIPHNMLHRITNALTVFTKL